MVEVVLEGILMNSPVLLIYIIFQILSSFSGMRNPLLTLLRTCHVQMTSNFHANFRFREYSEVPMIVSYGFS